MLFKSNIEDLICRYRCVSWLLPSYTSLSGLQMYLLSQHTLEIRIWSYSHFQDEKLRHRDIIY